MSEAVQGSDLLLTYEEAAKRLGVRRSWLEAHVQAGDFPHRRLGRLVRFSADDLAEIVAMSRRAPVRRRGR